jgi:hypothetical protein
MAGLGQNEREKHGKMKMPWNPPHKEDDMACMATSVLMVP